MQGHYTPSFSPAAVYLCRSPSLELTMSSPFLSTNYSSLHDQLSWLHGSGIMTSHSIQHNGDGVRPVSMLSGSVLESEMRMDCSAGDNLQIRKGCNNGRYSREERKERIERYKWKRNKRNFNKKIQYACRKTLADSRPRIRGRFARNNEEEGEDHDHDQNKNSVIRDENSWSHTSGDQEDHENEDEDDNYWINFLDTYSPESNSLNLII